MVNTTKGRGSRRNMYVGPVAPIVKEKPIVKVIEEPIEEIVEKKPKRVKKSLFKRKSN